MSQATEVLKQRQSPQIGDFIEKFGGHRHKVRLLECPICALDPDRERSVFIKEEDDDSVDLETNPNYQHHPGTKPHLHFLHEHGPDDIGRPMAELLPEQRHG